MNKLCHPYVVWSQLWKEAIGEKEERWRSLEALLHPLMFYWETCRSEKLFFHLMLSNSLCMQWILLLSWTEWEKPSLRKASETLNSAREHHLSWCQPQHYSLPYLFISLHANETLNIVLTRQISLQFSVQRYFLLSPKRPSHVASLHNSGMYDKDITWVCGRDY